VNQDGRPDLITGGYGVGYEGGEYVSVLLADGAGGFHSPIVHDAGQTSGWSYLVVATGDLNGDARPDVGVASINYPPVLVNPEDISYNVRVLLNDGAWTPPPPLISISDVTVTEGNTGTRPATFTVTLSAASTETVTVAYAAGKDTATAGSDYQATSGTLTFAPGETEKTITVPVNGDRLGEANETFVVNLSSPTNATIADGQGVGTIVDDEPRIRISNVSTLEGQAGQTTLFTFTVTLSAAYDQPVMMSFRTVNGTAKANRGDYVAQTGTLTFAPGETTKTITIEVNGDSKREAHEQFYLDLFGNSSNSLFNKDRGIGTILNDD
jgi:Calx-beta domain/FG-GAP-like repeat